MFRSLIVAKYTLQEAIKSKLLLNVVFLGLALLGITLIATSLTYGAAEKVSLDVGLGLISLALKVIAVFYGVGIIQQEIETRSIYLILSRPIARSSYLIGRIAGMGAMLFLNIVILGPFAILLFAIQGGELSGLMIWTLLFTFFESIILLLLLVVFSLFCSKVLAILFSISAYIGGYVSSSLLESNKFVDNVFINATLKVSNFILPNFSRLNIRDFLLYEQKLPSPELFQSLSHAFIYSVSLILIGVVIFKEKNLD